MERRAIGADGGVLDHRRSPIGWRNRQRIYHPAPCLVSLPRQNTAPTTGGAAPDLATLGEVAEWLNAPHSKCGIGASLSGVRIPPSPPSRFALRTTRTGPS